MKALSTVAAATMLAGSLQAAVTITVSDQNPGNSDATTDIGTIGVTSAIPATTYTLTGVDLTSEGGTANETIVFNVTYSQTGGTAVQFNSFNNVSVTGGTNDFQIDEGESLTATVGLVSSTFNLSGVTLNFAGGNVGGLNTNEAYDLGRDVDPQTNRTVQAFYGASSFYTITAKPRLNGDTAPTAINLSQYNVKIKVVAVPEPSSTALLGLGGLALMLRRRR